MGLWCRGLDLVATRSGLVGWVVVCMAIGVRCTSVRVYTCTSVQVYMCTAEQLYRCKGVEVYRCICI